MGTKRRGCGIGARKVSLVQSGVDLAVAEVVHQHSLTALASLEAGHEVMTAGARARRDRAEAKRADRVGAFQVLA